METVIKVVVGLKFLCLAIFGALLVVALVYTSTTEPPPRPDESFTAMLLHDLENSPDGCVRFLRAV